MAECHGSTLDYIKKLSISGSNTWMATVRLAADKATLREREREFICSKKDTHGITKQ